MLSPHVAKYANSWLHLQRNSNITLLTQNSLRRVSPATHFSSHHKWQDTTTTPRQNLHFTMPYLANVIRFLWTHVVVFVSTACSTFFLPFRRNVNPRSSGRLNLVVVDAEVNGRRKLVVSYCRSVFMIGHNPFSLSIDNKWGHFPSRSTQHRPKPNSLWGRRQHFSPKRPNKLILHDIRKFGTDFLSNTRRGTLRIYIFFWNVLHFSQVKQQQNAGSIIIIALWAFFFCIHLIYLLR